MQVAIFKIVMILISPLLSLRDSAIKLQDTLNSGSFNPASFLIKRDFMDKRAFERIPVLLYAQLYCEDSVCDALVLNLSQNGIYFSAEATLSCGLDLDLSIPMESNELRVPFKIIRSSEKGLLYSRFGAELLSPSLDYLSFVQSHKTSLSQ